MTKQVYGNLPTGRPCHATFEGCIHVTCLSGGSQVWAAATDATSFLPSLLVHFGRPGLGAKRLHAMRAAGDAGTMLLQAGDRLTAAGHSIT